MKAWMLSELKDVLQCEIPVEAEITCVSTDTRSLPQGCLFVALRGERFDGHDFVPQAIAAGAVAAVTEQPIEGCPCLVVENTGRALLKIARIQGNRATGDCFVDLAGYAACGGELEGV